MKAYIQTINGEIPDDWVFSAMTGLKEKGIEIVYFDAKDVEELPYTGSEMVVAYIETTKAYFTHNNITIPTPLNIPEELKADNWSFLRRKVGSMTMKELKDSDSVPIFVKPLSSVKSFESGVISQNGLKRFVFADVPDDAMVEYSEVLDFKSEYRCFIHKGELKGMYWYRGDFTMFPDINTITQMLRAYTKAPISYTLDVGIFMQHGAHQQYEKTVLVECNDMWSVGHYGLHNRIYSTLLRDRWLEIIRESNASNNTKGTEPMG